MQKFCQECIQSVNLLAKQLSTFYSDVAVSIQVYHATPLPCRGFGILRSAAITGQLISSSMLKH